MIAVALLALALYAPWFLYPQSDAAHAVFRVAVCLAAAAGLAIPRGRLARWGLGLWAAGLLVSVIMAPDPWRAVWSTANRNEGAWQCAHYLLLVLVIAAAPRERVVRWLAVAATLTALVGWAAPTGFVDGRLAGAPGNPLYLAPLLMMGIWAAFRAARNDSAGSIPVPWLRSLVGRVKGVQLPDGAGVGTAARTAPIRDLGHSFGWNVVAAVLALGVILTGSKGVLVALGAAFGVWLLAKAPRLGLACAVCLAGALWVVPIPASGLIRLELGRVALHGIAAAPWGWGAEGFPFVWDEFWRGVAPTGEVWHDRAHSLVLDRAVEWGVVGVAGWLAVVVAAWRRAELPERAAIAAYLGFGLTMFEMMWGAAGFAVLLGYVLRGQKWRPEVVRPLREFGWAWAAVALVVGAAQLAQSHAAARAADFPAMQAAIERWSPIGGDVVELYLKAPQTKDSLAWAAERVEKRSPHATQQAMLLVAWDRGYCLDLKLLAPRRPDVKYICP